MKIEGIDGNYIWKYPHFAVRDEKSGEPKLSYQKENELIEKAYAFKQNYKKWYLRASGKLKEAIKVGKITNEQYDNFLSRQNDNVKAILIITEIAVSGAIYFDFEGFEKENINYYETKRVHVELNRIEYFLENDKRFSSLFCPSNIKYTQKFPFFAIKDETNNEDLLKSLTALEKAIITDNSAFFKENYENWYDDACNKLKLALNKTITQKQYDEFLEMHALIRKTIRNIIILAQKGDIQFDFEGFEKAHMGEYETKKVYLEFLKIHDYIYSVKKWQPYIIYTPIKKSTFFEMKDKNSPKAEYDWNTRRYLLDLAEIFQTNYKNWYFNTQPQKKIKYNNGEEYETFLEKQNEIVRIIKNLYDNYYCGQVYFDSKGFENRYMCKYDSENVYLEFKKIADWLNKQNI